jgi:hypothetical protein
MLNRHELGYDRSQMEGQHAMNEFNQCFKGLREAQKQDRYQRLAMVCLAHYPAIEGKLHLTRNAGDMARSSGKPPI